MPILYTEDGLNNVLANDKVQGILRIAEYQSFFTDTAGLLELPADNTVDKLVIADGSSKDDKLRLFRLLELLLCHMHSGDEKSINPFYISEQNGGADWDEADQLFFALFPVALQDPRITNNQAYAYQLCYLENINTAIIDDYTNTLVLITDIQEKIGAGNAENFQALCNGEYIPSSNLMTKGYDAAAKMQARNLESVYERLAREKADNQEQKDEERLESPTNTI